MLHNFLPKLQISLDRLEIAKAQLVAVAVSGGADSVSLAIGMHSLGYQVVALLVDHRLRADSASEILSTVDLMARFDIACVKRVWLHEEKISGNLENMARIARYALIKEMCHELHCRQVCLGHHADDQVETFLLNLVRGSGLDGLCAMPSKTHRDGLVILRPMLDFSKEEITSYLRDQHISWIEDLTNRDIVIKRNHLRSLLCQVEDPSLLRRRIVHVVHRLQSVKLVMDCVHEQNFQRLVRMQGDAFYVNIIDYIALSEEERLNLFARVMMTCSQAKQRGRIASLLRVDRQIIAGSFKGCTLMCCVIIRDNDSMVIRKEARIGRRLLSKDAK